MTAICSGSHTWLNNVRFVHYVVDVNVHCQLMTCSPSEQLLQSAFHKLSNGVDVQTWKLLKPSYLGKSQKTTNDKLVAGDKETSVLLAMQNAAN